MWLCYGTACGRGVLEGTMLLAQLSADFQSLPLLPTSKLGRSGADSQVGGFVCFRTLWISPTNSSVRLGFSPSATVPKVFFSQRF